MGVKNETYLPLFSMEENSMDSSEGAKRIPALQPGFGQLNWGKESVGRVFSRKFQGGGDRVGRKNDRK